MKAEETPPPIVAVEQQDAVLDSPIQIRMGINWLPIIEVSKGWDVEKFAWFLYWLPVYMLVVMFASWILKELSIQ